MDFETKVKMTVYSIIADTGRAPDAAAVAAHLQVPIADVLAAFEQLRQKRLLVLEPGDATRIRMAPPFSGVPTSFHVHARGLDFYANCV